MRITALLLAPLIAVSSVQAESLSAADREELLERLEKLRENADSKVSERFRLAITAYRSAAGSNTAALDFYVDCIEKVNFKDQRRKNSDFRDWKRREAEKLSAPGLRLALRLQLSWLILTLRAASEKIDRESLLPEVVQIMDAIVRDADKLKDHQQTLNQPVSSSVFARAYDLGNIEVDNWPLAPGELGKIYDEILLPPLRNPRSIAALRSAWIMRIQQEMALQEARTSGDNGGSKKIGTVAALRSPAYELFLAEVVPELQWQMELDLFKNGDEQAAALRMLGHVEKHINHKSARKWTGEFSQLLTPVKTTALPSVP